MPKIGTFVFGEWHLIVKFVARDRAFEQVFGLVGREFEQTNFQTSSNARGVERRIC